MDCEQCKESIIDENELIKCSVETCSANYHFRCAGIGQSFFRKMTVPHKKEWTCLKCKSNRKHETKVSKNQLEMDSSENLECKLEKFMSDVSNKLEILNTFKSDFQQLKKDNEEIKNSQQFIDEKYEDIKEQLKFIPALEKEVIKLQNIIQEKNKQIGELQARVIQLEQYGRNRNLEINEVAEKKGEDVEEIVVNVAKGLGVNLEKNDIEAAHRLPKTRGATRPATIIVQFARRKKRDEVFAERKKVVTNSQVTGLNSDRIYVSENLTPHFRNLLKEVKKKAKDLGYKYIWYKYGSVNVRKTDDQDVISITEMSQLGKIK